MTEEDRELKRIHSMTADEIKAELDLRGIDTTKAVSHVLSMVREAKRAQERRQIEQN